MTSRAATGDEVGSATPTPPVVIRKSDMHPQKESLLALLELLIVTLIALSLAGILYFIS